MPADDPTIADDSQLLRRIPLQASHIIWDSNRNRWRISSQSFRNIDPKLQAISVNLQDVLDQLGLPAESVLVDAARNALATIPVGVVRAQAQVIVRDPLPQDPSHAHVIGMKPKAVQKALAEAAEWVIPPPWVNPS